MTDLTLIGSLTAGLRQTFDRRYVKSCRTYATQDQRTAGISENCLEGGKRAGFALKQRVAAMTGVVKYPSNAAHRLRPRR